MSYGRLWRTVVRARRSLSTAAQRRRAHAPPDRTDPAATQPPETEDALFVSEVFTSIQGEGPFTGRPSVFLRLGRCNLECAWCDTKYTWLFGEPQRERVRQRVQQSADVSAAVQREWVGERAPPAYVKTEQLQRVPLSRLQQQLSRAIQGDDGGPARALVITGGEPLLHAKPLSRLLPSLFAQRLTAVEVETNGTLWPHGLERWWVPPPPQQQALPQLHFNVSPKLANSAQPEHQRIRLEVLRYFATQCAHGSIFKFVVESERDLHEVNRLVEAVGVDASRVWLMPQGTQAEELARAARERVIPWCLQHGYRYSHRVQVAVWGDRRGV